MKRIVKKKKKQKQEKGKVETNRSRVIAMLDAMPMHHTLPYPTHQPPVPLRCYRKTQNTKPKRNQKISYFIIQNKIQKHFGLFLATITVGITMAVGVWARVRTRTWSTTIARVVWVVGTTPRLRSLISAELGAGRVIRSILTTRTGLRRWGSLATRW